VQTAVVRCPSLCSSHVSILLKWLNISLNFFHCQVATSHTILVFPHQMVWQYSNGDPLTQMQGVWNSRDFWLMAHFISENDTRQSYNYIGRLIISHMWTMEWHSFQCPWATLNPDFQVMPLFEAEHPRSSVKYGHSCNGIIILYYYYYKCICNAHTFSSGILNQRHWQSLGGQHGKGVDGLFEKEFSGGVWRCRKWVKVWY